MDAGLYNSTINCPVCSKKIEVTNVRSKSYRVTGRDSDFCVYYDGLNPIFYEIFVCDFCGYAAYYKNFNTITDAGKKIVLENISSNWKRKVFSGERTIDNAIDAFKLALYNLQLQKAKGSEIARICIRLAWLYRLKSDPKERDFIEFALRYYTETYEKEKFPVDKLDEYTCMYMVAELNRRVGNLEEAAQWFSRLIAAPGAKSNPSLIENARDQFHLVKDELKEKKQD